jgi:hypothetical protein
VPQALRIHTHIARAANHSLKMIVRFTQIMGRRSKKYNPPEAIAPFRWTKTNRPQLIVGRAVEDTNGGSMHISQVLR